MDLLNNINKVLGPGRKLTWTDFCSDRSTGSYVNLKARMCYDVSMGGEVCLGQGEWIYRLDKLGLLDPAKWRSLSVGKLVATLLDSRPAGLLLDPRPDTDCSTFN